MAFGLSARRIQPLTPPCSAYAPALFCPSFYRAQANIPCSPICYSALFISLFSLSFSLTFLSPFPYPSFLFPPFLLFLFLVSPNPVTNILIFCPPFPYFTKVYENLLIFHSLSPCIPSLQPLSSLLIASVSHPSHFSPPFLRLLPPVPPTSASRLSFLHFPSPFSMFPTPSPPISQKNPPYFASNHPLHCS